MIFFKMAVYTQVLLYLIPNKFAFYCLQAKQNKPEVGTITIKTGSELFLPLKGKWWQSAICLCCIAVTGKLAGDTRAKGRKEGTGSHIGTFFCSAFKLLIVRDSFAHHLGSQRNICWTVPESQGVAKDYGSDLQLWWPSFSFTGSVFTWSTDMFEFAQ